jgi:hypothetical protein
MPKRGFGLAVGRVQSLQDTGWLPTGRHRPAAEYADLEARSLIEVLLVSGTLCAAGLQDQANGGACDHALQVGAPGRGTIDFVAFASTQSNGTAAHCSFLPVARFDQGAYCECFDHLTL